MIFFESMGLLKRKDGHIIVDKTFQEDYEVARQFLQRVVNRKEVKFADPETLIPKNRFFPPFMGIVTGIFWDEKLKKRYAIIESLKDTVFAFWIDDNQTRILEDALRRGKMVKVKDKKPTILESTPSEILKKLNNKGRVVDSIQNGRFLLNEPVVEYPSKPLNTVNTSRQDTGHGW